MKRETNYFLHLILCLMLLVLCLPGIASAAPERRIALVIGNGNYEAGPLRNPVNDATDMAAVLKHLGFEVILKKNVRHQEMEEAVEEFGKRLRRGGVGLFYYAGHGVQVGGINYLLPIGARINKESDVKHQALSAEKIMDEMAYANNGLNIVLLDACRDNPYTRSIRSAARGLAIVSNAPTGTFISYSTSPGNVARDGDGSNSPYTEALLRYMKEPGIPIETVFKRVRQKLDIETGGKQVPWELSSLKGDFYFIPQGSNQNDLPDTRPYATKSDLDSDTEPNTKTAPIAKPSESRKKEKLFLWPVSGKVVSRFGTVENNEPSNGIKILAAEKAPVVAAAAGKVIFSGSLKDLGETIIIKHSEDYATVYTHLDKRLKMLNDQLMQGEDIGVLNQTNPFLHFEIRHNNEARNPLFLLPEQ
jgi:murein DD-endopeptidase MepM/ murein hydrolase activator NlpD